MQHGHYYSSESWWRPVWVSVSGSATSALRTAPQSCTLNWEWQNRPPESVCSETKAFSAKCVMSSSSSGTHTHLSCTCLTLSAGRHPENKLPALLFMLRKAERFSLISDGKAGEKGVKALWMEREFHLDPTGLLLFSFFFKVSQSQRGRLIKTGLPLAVVLKASHWTSCSSKGGGGGGGPSLNTSPERRLYQILFLWFAVIFPTNTKKGRKEKKGSRVPPRWWV